MCEAGPRPFAGSGAVPGVPDEVAWGRNLPAHRRGPQSWLGAGQGCAPTQALARIRSPSLTALEPGPASGPPDVAFPLAVTRPPPVRTPAGTHPNCLIQLAQLCEDPICKYSHFCGVGVRARRMHSGAQFKAEQGRPESAAGSQGPVPRTGRWRAPEPGFLVRTRACPGIFLCTHSGSLSIAVSTL